MILIWRGWGILVVPIVGIVALAVGAGGEFLLRQAGYFHMTYLAVSLGLLAAAAANWAVGRRLNGQPPRELLDPATHERVLLYRRHTLFWLRMEYWSVPVLLGALFMLLPLLR